MIRISKNYTTNSHIPGYTVYEMWSCKWEGMLKNVDVNKIVSAAETKPIINKRQMSFDEMLEKIMQNEVEGK